MDDMIKRLNKLSTFIRLKVDSVISRHCLLCLKTGQPSPICNSCLKDFPLTENGCETCGQRLHHSSDNTKICGRCLSKPPAYIKTVSAFDYKFPVSSIIRRLKYQERGYWAKPLAQAIYPEFQRAFGHLHNAVLMPVPMHESQYFIRRDNHADLIAKHLARYANLPLRNRVVTKSRHTSRQAELSARMRRRNVKNSFSLTSSPPVTPIIIIDDVVTTGSTIDAIARQLIKGGATEIYGFSVARRSLE